MRTTSTSYFDQSAAQWDSEPRRIALMKAVGEAILREAQPTREMDVLDYGCGTGLAGLYLLPHVHSVTGADSSPGMLEVLRTKIRQGGAAAGWRSVPEPEPRTLGNSAVELRNERGMGGADERLAVPEQNRGLQRQSGTAKLEVRAAASRMLTILTMAARWESVLSRRSCQAASGGRSGQGDGRGGAGDASGSENEVVIVNLRVCSGVNA